MLLIREIMFCKPGKVKKMVENSLAMAKLMEEAGMGKMRIMTASCSERYWTIVSEYEVATMHEFEESMQGKGMTPELEEKFGEIMVGYRRARIPRPSPSPRRSVHLTAGFAMAT